MGELKTAEAVALGREIRAFLEAGATAQAFEVIAPLLKRRIHFAMLDCVAREFGGVPLDNQDAFLEKLARSGTMGSWPLIGAALIGQLDRDLDAALESERTLIVIGDRWYAADAVAERAAGTALVKHFDETLRYFEKWRADENRWVRRSIGVGVHVWAKRNKGTESHKAERILDMLEPLWSERELDAVKGIGWGLKTVGRYYPGLMKAWLSAQKERPHSALMMRKARTYL